ncbi:DUF4178 domain-containing protein [Hymenobacter arizonensis]|uniref:DUF4178 domain-containing protein n=1 Tax=Hymenobacter arizonensis TaxID=1227077 RepID=A0A1I5UZA3_HYMAR|nr:DUF4178 domain-containing protein [Hymenobacter arizonensis]SFQ00563.1 protein of unknown function [Hymenobacter arizonensis]
MSKAKNPAPESAQLTCPECQASITYYDVRGSSYYACAKCHTYFEYEDEGPPRVVGKYGNAPAEARLIPVGTLGQLQGRACRVVGFVQRREATNSATWVEYQLYQPDTNDYAQLAQYDGHWMLVRPAKRGYNPQMNSIQLPEGKFHLYNRYQSRVLYAEGEFDWDIESEKNVNISEYVLPPLMLVQEQQAKRRDWYHAQHLEATEVASAFGLSADILPWRRGVGAVQPNPVQDWGHVRTLTACALAALFLLQIALMVWRPSHAILQQTLTTQPDTTGTPGSSKVLVSTSFQVNGPTALAFDLRVDVDNQWMELPVSLVNEETGQGFEFTKTIEYYHGTESGESWTEGGFETGAVLSGVPAGRYHLNLYPISENLQTPNMQPLSITVGVTEQPVLPSNFFIAAVLLLAFPAVQWFRRISHESSRWGASDFPAPPSIYS